MLFVVVFLWLLGVAFGDFLYRKVWNVWVLAGGALGLAALLIGPQPHGVDGVGAGLGVLLSIVCLLPFYLLGWMGAGDVKFGVVLALWLGLSPSLLMAWVGGSLLASLHALVTIVFRLVRRNQQFQALLEFFRIPLVISLDKVAKESGCVESTTRRQRIQRTIPYAGYLALVALYLVWKKGPPIN